MRRQAMKKIFVTGATGFVGSNLVAELVRRGYSVHALTRRTSDRSGLDHERVRLFQGDILDRDSLRHAMRGCDWVFHVAAYAKNWSADGSVFYRQNVDGLRNVLDVARQLSVERLVYTSTVVTFGPTLPGTVGNEEMLRITDQCFTEYEHSKLLGERLALEYAAKGFPLVIVNPTRVYGPGKLTEGNSVSQMIELYDRGRMPVLLNGGVNVGNYVFVDDLVRGHIEAMERGRVGERYILGGENVSLKRFFELVGEVSGRRHLQFSLPASLARVFAWEEQKKAEWFGIHPRITAGWVETFLRDWAFSCSKAENELGYVVTPLKEGIRLTYDWLLQRRVKRGTSIIATMRPGRVANVVQKISPRSLMEACEEEGWSNFWPMWSRR
jgi:nucleoside-diphosphate-sugar epimerase